MKAHIEAAEQWWTVGRGNQPLARFTPAWYAMYAAWRKAKGF